MPNTEKNTPYYLSWLIWACATLFFAYAFFQRTAPSVFVDQLSSEFSLSGGDVGALASSYFYSYALLQIPLGMLLDTHGALTVLFFAGVSAAASSLLFALAIHVWVVSVARLLVGASVGAGWLSVLKICATDVNFQEYKTGITGISMLIGLGGGVLGQGPLALGVNQSGWRFCMAIASCVPLITSLLVVVIWRLQSSRKAVPVPVTTTTTTTTTNPMHAQPMHAQPSASPSLPPLTMSRQLRIVCFTPINRVLFVYALFCFAPLLAFGSLWAVPYFRIVGGYDNPTAGVLASLFLVGTGLGSPVSGFVSDRFQGRKRTIIVCGVALSMTSMVLVLIGTGTWLPFGGVGFLMVTSGLGVSAMQLLAFFVATQHNAPNVAAGATAVVNTAGLLSGAIFQPLVGALLDTEVVPPGGTNETRKMGYEEDTPVWSVEHMRTVYCSVFLTCYLVTGGIAAFVLPAEDTADDNSGVAVAEDECGETLTAAATWTACGSSKGGEGGKEFGEEEGAVVVF